MPSEKLVAFRDPISDLINSCKSVFDFLVEAVGRVGRLGREGRVIIYYDERFEAYARDDLVKLLTITNTPVPDFLQDSFVQTNFAEDYWPESAQSVADGAETSTQPRADGSAASPGANNSIAYTEDITAVVKSDDRILLALIHLRTSARQGQPRDFQRLGERYAKSPVLTPASMATR